MLILQIIAVAGLLMLVFIFMQLQQISSAIQLVSLQLEQSVGAASKRELIDGNGCRHSLITELERCRVSVDAIREKVFAGR